MVVLLGATPVTMRPDEAYQAVSRGVADGALMPFTGMETFKIHEVAKMHLDVALGGDRQSVHEQAELRQDCRRKAKAAIDKNSGLALSQLAGKATQDEWEARATT